MKGVVIMIEFIIGWIIGKNIENTNQEQKIQNYEPIKPYPKKEEKIIYEYWPAFDNDIPSLEIAYKLYEENNVCHVIQDGICKCYFEFEGDEDYIKTKPNVFFKKI